MPHLTVDVRRCGKVAALNQIIERGYATKFKSDNRHVIMIGANFSTSKRTLDNWLIK